MRLDRFPNNRAHAAVVRYARKMGWGATAGNGLWWLGNRRTIAGFVRAIRRQFGGLRSIEALDRATGDVGVDVDGAEPAAPWMHAERW